MHELENESIFYAFRNYKRRPVLHYWHQRYALSYFGVNIRADWSCSSAGEGRLEYLYSIGRHRGKERDEAMRSRQNLLLQEELDLHCTFKPRINEATGNMKKVENCMPKCNLAMSLSTNVQIFSLFGVQMATEMLIIHLVHAQSYYPHCMILV